MRIVWSSDDNLNHVIRFNKKEIKIIDNIINSDKLLNEKFDVIDIEDQKYLFKQKEDIEIEDCVNFLKLRFAKDMIEKFKG